MMSAEPPPVFTAPLLADPSRRTEGVSEQFDVGIFESLFRNEQALLLWAG